ncbi:MAG: hypothetical protein ACOCZ6_01450 [Nanoarchaeota archaeon]
MDKVYLALKDEDKERLEKALERRHIINRDINAENDYCIFDPAVLIDWQDYSQSEETDFIALCSETWPDLREMMNKGVVSYFYKPYEVRNVMNLIDRISRFRAKDNRKHVLILDTNETFLDECRKELTEYEIITAKSPEAVYEIVFSNKIDAAVFSDYYIDLQIIEHISDVTPLTNFIVTNKKDKSTENLQHRINKALKNKSTYTSGGKGQIYAIMGPKAAGKTTLVSALEHTLTDVYKVVRAVGREPRTYEIQGEDHLFIPDPNIINKFNLTYRHKKGYMVGIDEGKIWKKLEEGKEALLTVAQTDFYEALEEKFSDLKPLMVLSKPEDLEERTQRRDIIPETLAEAKKDYEKCLEFANKKNIKSIYNPEPWFNPYYTPTLPTFEEFRAISSLVKQGRQFFRG